MKVFSIEIVLDVTPDVLGRGPGKIPAGKVINEPAAGYDWVPPLMAADGNLNSIEPLKNGTKLGGKEFMI